MWILHRGCQFHYQYFIANISLRDREVGSPNLGHWTLVLKNNYGYYDSQGTKTNFKDWTSEHPYCPSVLVLNPVVLWSAWQPGRWWSGTSSATRRNQPTLSLPINTQNIDCWYGPHKINSTHDHICSQSTPEEAEADKLQIWDTNWPKYWAP